MPMSTTCKFRGKVITVEEALRLKDEGEKDFFCIGFSPIGKHRVRPHRESPPGKKYHAAYFYHPESEGGRHTHCELSTSKHKARRPSRH
jgi:hypothetical protein